MADHTTQTVRPASPLAGLAAMLRRFTTGDTDGGGRYRCTACNKMVPLSHVCPKASRSGFLDRYSKTGHPSRLSHSVETLRPR